MPNLSANISLLFTELPLLDRIKAAADSGFSGIELHSPYETPIEDLLDIIEKTKIKITLFNFPSGDFSEGGPGIASMPEREAHFRAAVAEAKMYVEALNPFAINLLSGCPPSHIDSNDSKKIFINNLRYAADRFQGTNCQILVEPINHFDRPNFLINTTIEAIDILQKSKVNNVKVLFDTYHMYRMREDILKSIKINFNYIGHIQLADCPGRNQPGTGEINFKKIFELLKTLDYNNWLGAEYIPISTTKESLYWLKYLDPKN
jgi:hydroxypyruvate isomerase